MLMIMRAGDSRYRWCSVGGDGRVSLVRNGNSVENILTEVLLLEMDLV